jgi:site-specific DNA recombinase
MKAPSVKPVRCAIYTRVSTDHGLDQEFNSLDAQYDAASAYIKSQAHAGWTLIRSRYDDGGYSGGSTDRPACKGFWTISAPGRLTSSSSTRSTA